MLANAAETAGYEPAGTDRWLVLAVIFTASLGVAAFIPALSNEFVYDDQAVIVANPLVTQPGPWYRFWNEPYWPRGVSSDKLYRPFTIWSFRVNTVLWGPKPDPFAFHMVNLALHAASSVGVALLAWRLTRQVSAAWIAGALFATHPLHTESVVTGYGRAELLAGFFGIWLLFRHATPAGTGGWRSAWFHVASALLFLAAVMSKEHALFLWPCILLIDLWPRKDQPVIPLRERLNRFVIPSHIGLILAAALFFCLRVHLFGGRYVLDSTGLRIWDHPVGHASFVQHLLLPFRLLWVTTTLIAWPPRLCPIWSYPALGMPQKIELDVFAGMLIFLGATALAVACWFRRWRVGAMICTLLLLLLLPLQAVPMARWFFAERWLYLPSAVIAVLAGLALSRLKLHGVAAGTTLAVLLLPATWSYSAAFSNNLTMNREVVRRQPENFQGRKNLAISLLGAGDYHEAIEAAQVVIDLFEPTAPVSEPYLVLTNAYLQIGDGRRALEALERYEQARKDVPEPSLIKHRQAAEELIARERHRTSRQASRPDP